MSPMEFTSIHRLSEMKANNYYSDRQLIGKVDRKGNVIGEIEKWAAHKTGALHKGFSVVLFYNEKIILQHRKHPAFDGVLDLTISSHPLFINGRLQTTQEAALQAIKREWKDVELSGEIKNTGFVYYKSKDPKSIYTEHEICDILIVKLKSIPTPNFDYAYGFSLVSKEDLKNEKSRIYENLSPWSKKVVDKDLI